MMYGSDAKNYLSNFIKGHKITMTLERATSNPNMMGNPLPDSHHWLCKIARVGAVMDVYFTQRSAPTLMDVLDCLASDAQGFESARSFEDWASEYGYDTDSRTAEKTYYAVAKQTQALKDVLGSDAFDKLLRLERI